MMHCSKITIQPEHGDMTGYRLVQEGEEILPDDEYFDTDYKKWNTYYNYTPHKMSDIYVAHRRKLPEKRTLTIEVDYIKLGCIFRNTLSMFAAKGLLDSGPLDYYLEKLSKHSEVLLSKFAVFKIGDRCVIINTPNGYQGREKTFEIGSIGTIVDIDYNNDFVYGWKPDQDFYQDYTGKWQLASTPRLYWLRREVIAKKF